MMGTSVTGKTLGLIGMGRIARAVAARAAHGFNILGSHVYTTREGLALEIYRISTPPGGDAELEITWAELPLKPRFR